MSKRIYKALTEQTFTNICKIFRANNTQLCITICIEIMFYTAIVFQIKTTNLVYCRNNELFTCITFSFCMDISNVIIEHASIEYDVYCVRTIN